MRVAALIKRIVLEMLRDKRTLALMFIAPLLILTLMHFLFNGEKADLKLGVAGVDEALTDRLDKAGIVVKEYASADRAEETVVDDDLDGMLIAQAGEYRLVLQNSDPLSAGSLKMKVNQTIAAFLQSQQMKGQAFGNIPKLQIDTDYVYGSSKSEFFDVLSPILVGFFVFFFVFIISGIGLLKERMSGTLYKLMSTPVRRWEIVTAYLCGYGIFALIQTVIVILYALNVLDIVLAGSFWHVLLINLILALVALSLGTLLSSFAESEFQMLQFIPVVIVPQVFFSGIIPFDGMAEWVQTLAKFMPLYYGGDALKEVMYKGNGLGAIESDLIVLILFAAFFIALNLFSLKKYRAL